ncbi:glycoside hydrolase domain-containing protein [Dictyobacter formicarum]|uniref:glycoside hydrolase domain-containing protein n=1 Tax=Dictyobacter formicarum TaxID=2778368 RepID=UPI001915F850|nr:glycoside hydrolase domain-containing protein [Dictyobacter formicarum]
MSERVFETRCLSSLSKVFADEELLDESFSKASALREETYSFQVAFRSNQLIKRIRVSVHAGELGDVLVRKVGLVPSELPCYHDHDNDILRTMPGLYPDPLYPIDDNSGVVAFPNQWRAIWVTIKISREQPAGSYPVEVLFNAEFGELLGQEIFTLEVIGACLPEQKLIHTEWFYADCLATWYDVKVFSEEHWKWIETYVENAANHGINMILTPIFTPALETEIGHERPTVQLIDVKKEGDQYSFDFHKLDRWIELCQCKGIHYFEFAHLFTQWGAKHAPKIIAEENGESKQIFGWDTDALGTDYRNFLAQFLPALTHYLENHQLQSNVYFHISDEPDKMDLDHYKTVSQFVRSFILDYPVIDALSDYEFYQIGTVTNPVPSNDHINYFLEQQVKDLWTYYCCGQYKGVSNRFFQYAFHAKQNYRDTVIQV